MRKSCHEENRKMLEAYQLYQKGDYTQSLSIYESILDRTSNSELRYNLICTISVISTTVGNYNYALQILQSNLNVDMGNVSALVKIRSYANLCFLQIIMGLYEEAIYIFGQIRDVIKSSDNLGEIVPFVFKLFFRVSGLDEISKQVNIGKQISLMEAFYMLNLAFAKEMCGFEGAQVLLKVVYPIFIANKKMELAVVCLRQLLLLPLPNKDTLRYEKELGKILSMDLMEEYELDNAQATECCKFIAEDLVRLARELNRHVLETKRKGADGLWRVVLHYENRKLMTNASVCEQEKTTIQRNIEMMLKQKSSLIISQMVHTDFYLSASRQIEDILMALMRICQRLANTEVGSCFRKLVTFTRQSIHQRTKTKSQTLKYVRRAEKENQIPITLTRDMSNKSLKPSSRRQSTKTYTQSHTSNQNDRYTFKFIYKAIKFCEYGSFLSKRNFNSDGGEYRFVRITHSVLKWAKNPQKIEQSCQLYPLKDINSIHYGKCTPTLLKQSNHLLREELCFSLRLQKRTLDFYCKDFEQVSSWVCGFSAKLKQINQNFKGYGIGRMLWKKMFMVLRENFTDKIRKHERKFYYETAQAIILFGKNDCKLPTK